MLVNNRRHVTSSPGDYYVDVNTIPSDLIERVDLVTGGNSAVYGSDAVAGVVNFVTRRDFEGLRLRGQAGVSSEAIAGRISCRSPQAATLPKAGATSRSRSNGARRTPCTTVSASR